MHGVQAVGMSTLSSPLAVRCASSGAGAASFQQLLLDAMRKLDSLRQSHAAPPTAQSDTERHAVQRTLHTAQQVHSALLSAYNEIKEMGG